MNPIPAARLVDEARNLKGTKWRHQGRSRTGVDCIGLILLAGRNAGVDILACCDMPDRRDYGRQPMPELLSILHRHCAQIDRPVPGAVIFLRFPNDKLPRHFAIYSERGTIIHSEAKARGEVIEHGYRSHWLQWTHSIWCLPGVLYE